MKDLFEKLIYTAVGAVSITAEKAHSIANELARDNKISLEEGKKLVDEIMEKTASRREDFENQLKRIVEDVTHNFKFVKAKDYDDLLARLEMMEQKMGLKADEFVAQATSTVKKRSASAVDNLSEKAENLFEDAKEELSELSVRRKTMVRNATKKADKMLDQAGDQAQKLQSKGKNIVAKGKKKVATVKKELNDVVDAIVEDVK